MTLRVPRGHNQNIFFGNSKILKKAYEGHNIVEQKHRVGKNTKNCQNLPKKGGPEFNRACWIPSKGVKLLSQKYLKLDILTDELVDAKIGVSTTFGVKQAISTHRN